jgi:hypothetical protein
MNGRRHPLRCPRIVSGGSLRDIERNLPMTSDERQTQLRANLSDWNRLY